MPRRTGLDFWLAGTVKSNVDRATCALHKQWINDYILPHLGPAPVASLTAFAVKQWLDFEKKGRAADLRNKVGQLLRRGLKLAVRRGLTRANVAALVALPQADTEQMKVGKLRGDKMRKRPATAAGRSSIGEELVPRGKFMLPGRKGRSSRCGEAVSEARSTHPVMQVSRRLLPALPPRPAVFRPRLSLPPLCSTGERGRQEDLRT